MRSSTASRAVSISTGTRLPAAAQARGTPRARRCPGRPMSSTTASGAVGGDLRERRPGRPRRSAPRSRRARARAAAASRSARSSSTISSLTWAIVAAPGAFLLLLLRRSYAAPTERHDAVPMRPKTRYTAIVLTAAVALASAAYAIGSASGGGSATAGSNGSTAPSASVTSASLLHRRSTTCEKLGVDADELAEAMRDFHDRRTVSAATTSRRRWRTRSAFRSTR